jgi:hypothetical protein
MVTTFIGPSKDALYQQENMIMLSAIFAIELIIPKLLQRLAM